MKYFRTSGLITFIVLFCVIFGGTVFFAETIIKSSIEKYMTNINGAKVSIEKLILGWSPLSFKAINIEVTNKQQPMTNSVQIKNASFVVSTADLFLGKLIIDDMSLLGIKVDTQRKTSGAIEITAEPTIEEKTKTTDAAVFEMPDIELPDAKELLKIEPLTSKIIFKAFNNDLNTTKSNWINIKSDLKDKKRWDAHDKNYKKIRTDMKGGFAQKISAIKLAKELKNSLKGESKRFKLARESIKKDLNRIEKGFKTAKAAPGNDLKRIKDKFNLDQFNPENISQSLFGSQTTEYALLAKKWYLRIKPYLSDGESDTEKKDIARSDGIDIRFEEHNPQPDVYVRMVAIDIETPRGMFAGSINDISSDQTINKKPMRFKLSGVGMRDRALEQIDGIFNYVKKNGGYSQINYKISKQQIKDFKISKSRKFSLNLHKSLMDFNLSARLQNSRIKGNGRFDFKQVEFQSNKSSNSSSMSSLLASSFSTITQFNINAKLEGTLHDLNFSIESDIDNQLGDNLKLKLKEIKLKFVNELKAEIDKKLKEPLKKIEEKRKKLYQIKAEINAKEAEFKQKLASLKTIISQKGALMKKELAAIKQREIAKAKAKYNAKKAQVKAKLEAVKKANKAKIDAEKKKQKEKLKNDLKNKFKKFL